jgi:VCBS repeat-containing protein
VPTTNKKSPPTPAAPSRRFDRQRHHQCDVANDRRRQHQHPTRLHRHLAAHQRNSASERHGASRGSTFTQADIDAGLVTYDHDDSQTSSDSFAFTVDDGSGTTSSGTFNFTITNVNDAPVISIEVGDSTTASLTETNGTLTGSGTLSVTDVDPDDEVTASVISVSPSGTTTGLASDNAALLAMLSVNSQVLDGTSTTGDITWTFNSATEAFDYLAVGQQLTLVYTIEVEDLEGATDSQQVTITITGTNDAPTITVVDVNGAVTEDASTPMLTDSGSITFAEVDETDLITSSVALTSTSTTGPSIPTDLATALEQCCELGSNRHQRWHHRLGTSASPTV